MRRHIGKEARPVRKGDPWESSQSSDLSSVRSLECGVLFPLETMLLYCFFVRALFEELINYFPKNEDPLKLHFPSFRQLMIVP